MGRNHFKLNAKLWRKVRADVLDRDDWRCVKCERYGRMEVDHIVRLEDGGDPYELGNLQTLCRACHIAKTAAENTKHETPGADDWRDYVRELLDS